MKKATADSSLVVKYWNYSLHYVQQNILLTITNSNQYCIEGQGKNEGGREEKREETYDSWIVKKKKKSTLQKHPITDMFL